MTPSARVQAAIDVIDAWQRGTSGLDRVLTAWGRANRYAGSGDRRAIADLVYDAIRCKRSAAWIAGSDDGASADGRQILQGYLLLEGSDPDEFFTGLRHAPTVLSCRERQCRDSLDGAPRPVRLDYPDWLSDQFRQVPDDDLHMLRKRAPLDLRVNSLRAQMPVAIEMLAADGIGVVPLVQTTGALRVVDGERQLRSSRAYNDGIVEIQDVSSQAVAALANAKPGEKVLDLCAGGGGKTLAMAADMANTGTLFAHDISPARMADLPERLSRAGARANMLATDGLDDHKATFDLVLVDAPCSGSGAWRRNPDAKWRLDPAEFQRLLGLQRRILQQAAELVKPDGRIAYATCSICPAENDEQAELWVDANVNWRISQQKEFSLGDGGDGFYSAILTKV